MQVVLTLFKRAPNSTHVYKWLLFRSLAQGYTAGAARRLAKTRQSGGSRILQVVERTTIFSREPLVATLDLKKVGTSSQNHSGRNHDVVLCRDVANRL